MSDDVYKGESPAKKIARLAFWQRVLACNEDGKIVVLASREMGDYSVLRALGHGDRVVAVDRVESAVLSAREKFVEADVRHADVIDVANELRERIAIAFLDFCSPICKESVDTMTAVARTMRIGSILGVGVLRGREKDGRGIDSQFGNRQQRRSRLASSRKGDSVLHEATAMMNHGRAGARSLHRAIAGDDGARTKEARTIEIMMLIDAQLRPLGKTFVPFGSIHYQSRTRENNGVPMSYIVGDIAETHSRLGKDLRNRTFVQTPRGAGFAFDVSVDSDPDRTLREIALSMDNDGVNAAAMLNVSPGTIAAWKAHETMGTYAREAR